MLHALVDEKNGVISSMKEIDAVGHRVVHGGEKFAQSVLITDEVMAAIEECNPLAPLHNPANIIGIKACQELMPGTPMVPCSTPPSTRPCLPWPTPTPCPMSTMSRTRSAATASTAPATSTCLSGPPHAGQAH